MTRPRCCTFCITARVVRRCPSGCQASAHWASWRDRLEDGLLLWRYAGQEFVGVAVAPAGGRPRRAVTVDEGTALTGIGTGGCAVGQAVAEQQRVALLEVHLHNPGHGVHRGVPALVL